MDEHVSDAVILAWLDQEDRLVTETIRRHGCFVEQVLGEGGQPPFAYTVGLFGIGHPELIVVGLGARNAAMVLMHCFDRVRDGSDLMPGEVVQPPGAPMGFLVEQFPDPGSTLLTANRHYRRPPEASVPAYRLSWSAVGR